MRKILHPKLLVLFAIAFFIAINARAQIVLDFTVDKTVSCNGLSDGAATVKAKNGTAPYTYLWATTDTTRSVTGLKAGYYVVTATDAGSNTVTDSVFISEPGVFTAIGESLIYEETFSNGQSYVKGSDQYDNWVKFIDAIDPTNNTYTSITLSGTQMTGEKKLTDATAVMNLIKAIDGGYDHTETVNGVDWTVGHGCFAGSSSADINYAIEINATPGTNDCGCTAGPILRPGIANTNWGGFGSTTCGAPTQTMRIELGISGITQKNVKCWRNENGLVALEMFGGTRPFSFAWSTSNTDSFITSLDTGYYRIVATDANGCQYKDTFHISEPDTLIAHASLLSSVSCFANVDGSAKAIVTGGTMPYSYSWTGGDSVETSTTLSRGNIQVLVTDANGCSDTGLVVIPSPAPVTVSIAQGSEYSLSDGDSVLLYAQNPDTTQTYYWIDQTRSGTGVWEQVGTAGFSQSYVYFSSIKVDKGTIYAAYRDGGASNKATLMTYDGNKWDTLGSSGFSLGTANYIDLEINNGVPYVVYSDQSASSKACVMKYTGTKWDTVGNYAFSLASTGYLDLEFDGNTPYVAYFDGGRSGKATVRKFNGTNWDTVGTSGFTTSSANYLSMAIDNGVVYIAFQDAANSSKASVMKFDGTNWVNVGTGPVSAGYADYLSLTFNSGIAYLAYRDAMNSYRATVKSFDGSAWNDVGNAGFTGGTSSYNNLVFSNNIPYLSFQDNSNGNRASVMKFENNKWVTAGSLGFSSGSSSYNSFDIQNDTLYVGFQDNGNSSRASVMSFYGKKTTYNDSIMVKDTGVYVLTSIDTSGCSGTDTIVVKKLTMTLKLAVDSHETCSGLSNGGATAVASGGTRPYTYVWTGLSATDSFITNAAAGTYYLSVTDANNNTLSDSVKINSPSELKAVSGQNLPSNTTLNAIYGGWLDNSTGIVESNPTSFVFAGQTSGTDHKGWLKFDVSGIPDGSQVDSIVLELYCNRANGSGTLNIDINSANDVEGPFGSPNSTAYADFGNGTYTSVAVTGTGTYSSINLGNNATSDLENQLADGYFQIALDNHNSTDWKRFTSDLCKIKVYYLAPIAISENLCYGEIADTINTIDSASGGSGSYTYFWEVSSDLGANYTAAPGDNDSIYYTPTARLFDTTYYRRGVIDLTCGDTVFNNPAKIYVADTLSASLVVDSNATNNSSMDAGVSAVVSGGFTPYTYSWSNSVSTANNSGLGLGWYTLTVTDKNGCVFIDSIEVKRRFALTLTVDSNVTCNGLLNGGATATIDGGVQPLTYEWLNTDTTKIITGLAAGTYTFRVIDANKDTLIDSVTITQPAVLAASALVDSNVTCYGLSNAGATAAATGGTAPYTYSWSNSATTASIVGISAGGYSITITDNNGCEDTSSVTVIQPDSISLTLAIDSTISCNGLSDGGATANVSGGTFPYTYQWSNSATTASITGVSAGTYTVSITDANGCFNKRQNDVTEPATLSATVGVDSNVTCNGDLSGVIAVNSSGGTMPYTYNWSNSATTSRLSKLAAGTYSVTLTDANGCTDTDNGTITEPSKLIAGIISGDTFVCSGIAPNALKAPNATSGGVGSYTYQWQKSADSLNWSDISGAKSTTYQPGAVAGNTWYRRLDSDGNQCGPFATNAVKISIYAQPNAGFTATAACEGKQTNFTDTTSLAFGSITSYAWSFGDKGTSSQQNPINVYKNNGSYTVSLSVIADGGCKSTATRTVSVNPVPSVDFASTVECEGTATDFTNKSSISSGTLGYAWNLGDKNSSTATSPSYTYTTAGYYTVQLTATSDKGCIDSISKTVQVKQVARPNFSATSVCEGNNTSFTNLSTNAKTYSWDFGNSTGTSTKENPAYNYAKSGSYTAILTATSADGCSDTVHKMVTVYGLPTAGFSATEICLGETTDFTNSSKGATNYQWVFGNGTSSNKFEPSIIYGKAGAFSVELTATTANGCTDVTSSSVTVNALPAVSFTTADVCLSDALKTTNTTTGATAYAWTFGDGSGSSAVAPTHTYANNGNYKVLLVGTSAKGCVDSAKTIINAFAEPAVSYTSNDVCFGNSTEFKNNSRIAAGTMTYVWNLGDGTSTGNPAPSYTYKKDGTYSIKLVATSNNGCKDSTTGSVDVYAMPKVDFAAANVCYGDTMFTNNLSSGAASYAWNFGDGNVSAITSPFNFYTKAGNYNVQLVATTGNNCVDSLSKSVSIYAKPIAGFDTKDVCDETAVNLANTSYGAIINKNDWSFGDGTTSLVINPSHTYSTSGSYTAELITTSDNGCSDTISKLITIHPNPVVAFTNTTECDYDSTVFTNNTSIASGTATYAWNFGTGDNSNITSPKYMFPQAGAYVVGLKAVSDKGCERSATSTVVVHPSPVAGISLANNCEGFESNFKSTSSLSKGKMASYNWDLGDGNTSTNVNPVHLYNLDGVYGVSLIATTDKNCTDTALASITVYNKPEAGFNTPDVCFNQLSVFKDASIDAQDYLYDFGDKWGISTLASPEYTYESPGSYAATLYVTSVNGCKDTVIKTIVIHGLPEARFDVNNHCFGEAFEPTDKSKGNPSKWDWDYADGNTGTGSSPSHNYTKDGDYSVKLTVTDGNNCIDSFRKTVTVWPLPKVWIRTDTLVSKGYTVPLEARGGVVYKWSPVENLDKPLSAKPTATVVEDVTYTATVANQFGCIKDTSVNLRVREDYTLQPSNIMTPDGNGQNDNWVVEKAQYYNDVEVLVFDRWGRIVYQNKSYDNSWSGISNNGEPLPDGAYYYVVKVPTDRDEYKGSITIFR